MSVTELRARHFYEGLVCNVTCSYCDTAWTGRVSVYENNSYQFSWNSVPK